MSEQIRPLVRNLNTRHLGQRVLWFDEIDSTNNYLKEHAGELPHGAVAAAGFQSAGKGTRARTWTSRPGDGLAHSILLHGLATEDLSILPLLSGLAVASALRDCHGVDAKIKWSNDIVVEGRKICGILCESRVGATGDAKSAAIVGIGVNIAQTRADFERIGLVYATSLREVTGETVEPLSVAAQILNRLEPLLLRYMQEGFAGSLREEYKALCVTLNRDVRIVAGGEELTGYAEDIAHDGALIVTVNGVREAVRAGDVSVRGLYGYV